MNLRRPSRKRPMRRGHNDRLRHSVHLRVFRQRESSLPKSCLRRSSLYTLLRLPAQKPAQETQPARRRFTDAEKAKALKLIEEGKKIKEVAEQLQTSSKTVI